MEENRVSETLENILDAIDILANGIGDCAKPETAMNLSASAFALARTYDLLAQCDETAYQDGDFDEV